MRFDEILTNDAVLDALYDMHFDECTPIQELAIPIISEGRDLIGIAQTGTGKTAAYLLPVIDKLAEDGYPTDAINCLVLAPTRELAQQIDQQMEGFAYFMPVSSMAIYGGTNGEGYGRQQRGLKQGADVVIATPGRMLAHLSMGYVDLSQVSFLILDEADRMLDMGFYDDIMQIVSHLPKDRQTLMFSATMPPKIRKLAQHILNNPAEIRIAVSKPADKIRQEVALCSESQKMKTLIKVLSQEPFERVIIFASSKLKVKQLGSELRKNSQAIKGANTKIGIMHSDLEQSERDETMLAFRAKKVNVLVATDIVARGIDIDDITIVINYDVPYDPEDYVHRVGRTARADKDGRAVTFVTEREKRKLAQLEKFLGQKITRLSLQQEPSKSPQSQKSHKSPAPPSSPAPPTSPASTAPQQDPRKPRKKPYHKRHPQHKSKKDRQQPSSPKAQSSEQKAQAPRPKTQSPE